MTSSARPLARAAVREHRPPSSHGRPARARRRQDCTRSPRGLAEAKKVQFLKPFRWLHLGTLSLARRILRDAPDLAPGVLDGSMPFDRAART
jgi:hypothetical protein